MIDKKIPLKKDDVLTIEEFLYLGEYCTGKFAKQWDDLDKIKEFLEGDLSRCKNKLRHLEYLYTSLMKLYNYEEMIDRYEEDE